MPSSTKPSPRRSRAPVALALLALAGCAAVGWSARALAGVGRLDTLAAGVVSYAVESKVRGLRGERAGRRRPRPRARLALIVAAAVGAVGATRSLPHPPHCALGVVWSGMTVWPH